MLSHEDHMIPGETLNKLDKIINWSFSCLGKGMFPLLDPFRKEWPRNSIRYKLAGEPLCGEHKYKFMYAMYCADWKYY